MKYKMILYLFFLFIICFITFYHNNIKINTITTESEPEPKIIKSVPNNNITKSQQLLHKQNDEIKKRTETTLSTRNENINPIIELTFQERNLLERLVEAEAGGEPFEGKLAVATVVVNRVNSDLFPNSFYDVIFQEKQFSPVSNGKINNTPSLETKRAVEKVIDENFRSFESDVVFFLNPKIATNKWIIENRTFVVTIGQHDFYK